MSNQYNNRGPLEPIPENEIKEIEEFDKCLYIVKDYRFGRSLCENIKSVEDDYCPIHLKEYYEKQKHHNYQ